MNTVIINDDLMQFLFEDMESDDSIVLQNYSINLLKDYLLKANEEERQSMRTAVLAKDVKKVISLIKNQDVNKSNNRNFHG